MIDGQWTDRRMNIRIPDSFQSVADTASGVSANAGAAYGEARGRRNYLLWIGGAIALVVIGLIVFPMFFGPAGHKTPPAPVVAQRVALTDFAVSEQTIGTAVSPATVQVTSRVQGQILKAFFAEGQTVHKGDLLFQIDPGPYRAAYDNALAALGTAKAKWARYQRLSAQNAIAPQDADDAKAAYLAASANADAARLNLSYTEIRSPIDGKTGPILMQPGNQVMATGGGAQTVGANPATATTLVVITQVHPIKISFALPQADLPRIQKRMAQGGMPVTLQAQGGGDTMMAKVDFIGNQVSGSTGTIELRATFPNEADTLVPGQLVNVSVVLDTIKHAMTVPHDAINLDPTDNYVYAIRNGVATVVPVKIVADDGTMAAISGAIRPGDLVIVDGQLKVAPGKPVSIVRPPKK